MCDMSHHYRNAYAAALARCLTMEETNLIYPNTNLDLRALTTSLNEVA